MKLSSLKNLFRRPTPKKADTQVVASVVKPLPLVEFTSAPTIQGRIEIMRAFYEADMNELSKTTIALVLLEGGTGNLVNVDLGSPLMLIRDSSKWAGFVKARAFEAKSHMTCFGFAVLNGSRQAISPKEDGIYRFASGGQYLSPGDTLHVTGTMNVDGGAN